MRIWRRVFLASVLGLGLAILGCTQLIDRRPGEEGAIHITIRPVDVSSRSAVPQVIPTNAEKVRIRVWHPVTGFNRVATTALGPQERSVEIPVPSGTGYCVDVVSYCGTNPALALTGGRAPNVTVTATEMTRVEISLQAWRCGVSGPTLVEAGKPFSLEFVASDGGGLLTTQVFETASLRASTTSFQDPAASIPPFPGAFGAVQDDRMTLSGTAPNVTTEATLFAVAMVEFNRFWVDNDITNYTERRLFLELPNRHTGDKIHELKVAAAGGGIVVEISGR